MHDTCKTVRILPTNKSQGDFVEINESDFDEKKHKLYNGKTPGTPPPVAKSYSDAVKNLASKHEIDLETVEGSGSTGNVVVKDIQAIINAKEAIKVTVDFASDEAGELAAELSLDAEALQDCEGTGEAGAITVEDLEKFVENKGE